MWFLRSLKSLLVWGLALYGGGQLLTLYVLLPWLSERAVQAPALPVQPKAVLYQRAPWASEAAASEEFPLRARLQTLVRLGVTDLPATVQIKELNAAVGHGQQPVLFQIQGTDGRAYYFRVGGIHQVFVEPQEFLPRLAAK